MTWITHIDGKPTAIFKDSKKDEWLWRYMDLPKFINLITNKSLYFSNARLFEDHREGYVASAKSVKLDHIGSEYLKKPFQDPNEPQRMFRNFLAVSGLKCLSNPLLFGKCIQLELLEYALEQTRILF